MKIEIRERLRPFTHKNGVFVPIPGTTRVVQSFPTLLRIYDFSGEALELVEEIKRPSPVEQFTTTLDLERGYVLISGKDLRTYVSKKGVSDKKPEYTFKKMRRLSFGVHKKQEWESVLKRGEMSEIFPFWMRLGQLIPEISSDLKGGVLQTLQQGDFKTAFLAGFSDILLPRAQDTEFQGFDIPKVESGGTPLKLLTDGAKQIEALFFKEVGSTIYILPSCPPGIKCGKMTDVVTESGVTLHFEWTKGTLRRLLVKGSQKMVQKVIFPRNLKRYRLRSAPNAKGVVCSTSDPVTLDTAALLLMDNFEK